MLGSGFIPLFMAYEYIKNRSEYCAEYFVIAVTYIVCLPVVYYDFIIYSGMKGFNFTLARWWLPFLFRGCVFVSGGFLLIKGLQIPYNLIIRKLNRKVET